MRAFLVAAAILVAVPAEAQRRTRQVASLKIGGAALTIDANSDGHVSVFASKGLDHVRWALWCESMREYTRGVRDTLAAASPGRIAPKEVVEFTAGRIRASDGSSALVAREMRSTGSRYRLHFADQYDVHSVVVWGSQAQYRAYLDALDRATAAVKQMNGVPPESDTCVR